MLPVNNFFFARGCRSWSDELKLKISYIGLTQSSFFFFFQLLVLCTRPPVGDLYGLGNGKCEFFKL